MIIVLISRAEPTSALEIGVDSLESRTTRVGDRPSRPGNRQVSIGSSARTVPIPVKIASWRARKAWTMRRAGAPVIHWLSPSRVAIRASKVVANFSVTLGIPLRTRRKNPARSSSAASRRTPSRTSIPASRSIRAPAPSTRESGSWAAITTRTMPAAINASAQGGVCPTCAQGSSDT